MQSYYSDKLSAHRLRRCYEIAPPRVREYLETEIEHACAKFGSSGVALELGCGYGRVLPKARTLVGIDTSAPSLELAGMRLGGFSNWHLLVMDAARLGFRSRVFDLVLCIQNGVSAFHVSRDELIRESIRVTRPGGKVLFSSYSDKFWNARLEWFELQAGHGLIGEIDHSRTGNGVIVCRDGFRATTVSPAEFAASVATIGIQAIIEEVNESSVFCEIPVV